MISLVPNSNTAASFLFEKQNVWLVIVSRSFLRSGKNNKFLKIDIYLNHASVLPFQVSVTIT